MYHNPPTGSQRLTITNMSAAKCSEIWITNNLFPYKPFYNKLPISIYETIVKILKW